MEEIQRRFYASKGAAAVRSLEKNGFAAHYAASRAEAAALLLSLIPDGAVVGVGDSHTIYALDLDEKLAAKGCQAIPSMAAPMNNLKYDRACACVKTGRCPSCDAPNRICNVTTILHKKPMRSDYHVILIGESLGF